MVFVGAKVENHVDEWGHVLELNMKQDGCTEGCLLWSEHADDAEWKGVSAVVAEFIGTKERATGCLGPD